MRSRFRAVLPFLLTLRASNSETFTNQYRKALLRAISLHAKYITVERYGITWTLALEDRGLSEKIFIKGSYQLKETEQVVHYVRENGYLSQEREYVVDIGANIGMPSIPFAKLTDLQIIAVEPLSQAFTLLQHNIAQNGL